MSNTRTIQTQLEEVKQQARRERMHQLDNLTLEELQKKFNEVHSHLQFIYSSGPTMITSKDKEKRKTELYQEEEEIKAKIVEAGGEPSDPILLNFGLEIIGGEPLEEESDKEQEEDNEKTDEDEPTLVKFHM